MNATEVHTGYQEVHQEAGTAKTIAGGALMETVDAVAIIALAIVGLTGTLQNTVAAIATIVLGAAIWTEGGVFVASHREIFRQNAATRVFEGSQALGTEFLGGLAAIALGILALVGVSPVLLLSIAVLAVGACYMSSSRAGVGGSIQSLFGLAGVVLGLLAVVGMHSIMLVLVALICFGASALFKGTATSARMASEMHKKPDVVQ